VLADIEIGKTSGCHLEEDDITVAKHCKRRYIDGSIAGEGCFVHRAWYESGVKCHECWFEWYR